MWRMRKVSGVMLRRSVARFERMWRIGKVLSVMFQGFGRSELNWIIKLGIRSNFLKRNKIQPTRGQIQDHVTSQEPTGPMAREMDQS